jgi:hypothetical protein
VCAPEPLGVDRQGAGPRDRGHAGQATQCDRGDAVHGRGAGGQALGDDQGRSVCGFPRPAGGQSQKPTPHRDSGY